MSKICEWCGGKGKVMTKATDKEAAHLVTCDRCCGTKKVKDMSYKSWERSLMAKIAKEVKQMQKLRKANPETKQKKVG